MEKKRMAMIMVMMLVMGNMIIETEALSFKLCYAGCLVGCLSLAPAYKKLFCPFMCIKECRRRSLTSETSLKQFDQTEYFCNLGCDTDRCASSSSIDDKDHVEKVSVCVDSCSETCSHKK